MSSKGKKTKKQKKAGAFAGFFPVLVLVLGLCAFLSYKKIMLENERDKVYAQYEAAEEAYEEEESRQEELAELSIYTKTKKFVEDIAREKFGMVYENEIIFTPEDE